MSDLPEVAGYCPMGCGMTLVLAGQEYAGEGNVTCAASECPRPDAVHVILQDPETEHIATIREDGFTVQHPLRERLNGALHECKVHQDIQALGGPPVAPGRYRVTPPEPDSSYNELPWNFDPLQDVRGDWGP